MRVFARRVKLDRDGYGTNGLYWGAAINGTLPLYVTDADPLNIHMTNYPRSHCRAKDNAAAVEIFKRRIANLEAGRYVYEGERS